MKDTLRLILFLECNMHCSYCCNEIPEVSKKFVKKKFRDIDFTQYVNICITGGEPFLKKDILYQVLDKLPADKNKFIYTNGTLIDDIDLVALFGVVRRRNLKCINIGLHLIQQLKSIINVEEYLPVRFMLQDIKKELYMAEYPNRLNESNIKTWKVNDCEMPNEDWVLLDLEEDYEYLNFGSGDYL